MTNYKNILIASDLSLETLELVARARLLSTNDTQRSLLHVIPLINMTYSGISSYVPDLLRTEEVEKKILEAKQNQITELLEHHKLHDLECCIKTGKASKIIKEHAENKHCDLILLGLHTEKGLRGSTATGVLHDAPCDVLSVRLYK